MGICACTVVQFVYGVLWREGLDAGVVALLGLRGLVSRN